MYKLTIPGKAIGKGRHQINFAQRRTYTPAKTVKTENWARSCCLMTLGSPLLEGPLMLHLFAYVLVPKSYSKIKRQKALAGEIVPDKKPDFDNIVKLYMDALNGVMWLDDKQIVSCRVDKVYSLKEQVVMFVEEIKTPHKVDLTPFWL